MGDGRDWREKRDTKFEVLGSKFQQPRTSDLEPPSVSYVERRSAIWPVVAELVPAKQKRRPHCWNRRLR